MQPEDDHLQPLRDAFLRPDDDAAAARDRTRQMADRLALSLSRLPSHVEFQGRPASELECQAMLEALPLFEQLAESAGLRHRYTELVDRCRLHYNAYRRYQAELNRPESGNRPENYEQFQRNV